MSAIQTAINVIKYNIPDQILRLAFMPRVDNFNYTPLSLDSYIRDKVIAKKVLVDCNIVGGSIALLPLNGLKPIYADPFTTVFRIPIAMTQGRQIMSALSVSYYPFTITGNMTSSTGLYTTAMYNNTSNVTAAAQRISDSVSNIPAISCANVELIEPNTIAVRDMYRMAYTQMLRCILENDPNLNNLNPRSWQKFGKLCTLACKSYIYNNLVVEVDKAYLAGGQELGSIKDIIDRYEDAEEKYVEMLETQFKKILFMNDMQSYNRLLKIMINPAL